MGIRGNCFFQLRFQLRSDEKHTPDAASELLIVVCRLWFSRFVFQRHRLAALLGVSAPRSQIIAFSAWKRRASKTKNTWRTCVSSGRCANIARALETAQPWTELAAVCVRQRTRCGSEFRQNDSRQVHADAALLHASNKKVNKEKVND